MSSSVCVYVSQFVSQHLTHFVFDISLFVTLSQSYTLILSSAAAKREMDTIQKLWIDELRALKSKVTGSNKTVSLTAEEQTTLQDEVLFIF